MQNCGSSILGILQSAQRDLVAVDCFEFYAPTETDLFPENAEKRFAATELIWYGWKYDRQAISRGDISRYMDGRFNNVQITLSNVDRTLGTWLSATEIEGYRVVIRMVSRSVADESIVLFVGRCDKPFDVDNTTVTIQAKQDLGSIENDLPWQQFSSKCPLKFKGTECLAGEAVGTKSAAYQAATTCNKSYQQCASYENTDAFQGFRFNSISDNFKVSARRGGAGGAFLGLLGLGNKRVTKQWTSQDATPYGRSVPLGLGRTQIDLINVQTADTGQYLAGQAVIGEGEVAKILNLRNVTAGWADTFQFSDTHVGEYGTQAGQAPTAGFFPAGDVYSHRAYAEYTILGTNPDTGDPAPTLAAVILWLKIPVFDDSCFTGLDWSDNPVEHLRYLLTEERSLNYNGAWIDNTIASETASYCNDPLIDTSGGEDVYVSTSAGVAGTSFKRYRSTGLLDTHYFRYKLGLTSTYPAEQEVTYNTYSPSSDPGAITPSTYYRKRYTANWHLREPVKIVDFIFKSLLPCFRGYLITGADGKLQIKSEKPTITSFLRSNVSAGQSAIPIEDAEAWKALDVPVIYALIGVGEATSETRQVSSIDYSTAGNSITLAASGSGTASGATLSGGTTSIQAQGYVTIGSAASCTITIDGVDVAYTANASDTTGTIAGILAARINANATLNRYVKAIWTVDLPNQVLIRSKLGTLNVSSGLTSGHTITETVAYIAMPFSDVAFGALTRGNILKNSFKWPLGNKQSSYNQFVMTYNEAVQDFQPTELRENDYDHQDKVNRINKLEISGACVDNYHQADRLVQATRYKYREGDFFNEWSTTGLALLLEEGDVVCTNHGAMPDQRNLLLRIEELKVAQDHRVNIVGRLYADTQFPTTATERTVVLTTGVGWVSEPPDPPYNVILTSPSSGVVRGTFSFAAFVGSQTARLEVWRAGEAGYVDTGLVISPDSALAGAFEVSGIPTTGLTQFRLVAVSSTGNESDPVTAAWNPAGDILEAIVFDWTTDISQGQGLDYLEVEVFR